MKSRLKLLPGQRGTKKLVEIYGDALICVRYRYDDKRHLRVKTVELAVETKDWSPPPAKFSDSEIVSVHISYTEEVLKQMAKSAGGRWDPKAKVWRLAYGKVKGTKLEKHLLLDALDKSLK